MNLKSHAVIFALIFILLCSISCHKNSEVENIRPYGKTSKNLALTPPMGWNSWNQFATNINEQLIIETIDAIVESGMRDARYQYVILDDGWQRYKGSRQHYPLEVDPVKFPRGIKYLADYCHKKGLKFGIYSGPGNITCAGYTGSLHHEKEDAEMWASWGVDYLKYDGCCEPGEGAADLEAVFKAMSDALNNCGRDIVLHVCHCGFDNVWEWAGKYGQQWRIGHDIADDFDYPGYWEDYYWDIMDMIDHGIGLEQYTKPGSWNDFDMLVVGLNGKSTGGDNMPGPGCTPLEYRTHFSMWCMLSSPLIAGNDIRNMDHTTIETLTNFEVIALDQDSLGIQASKIKDDGDFEIFAKPLANKEWSVALLNRGKSDGEMTINWRSDFGLSYKKARIRDLWLHKDIGVFTDSYTTKVQSHEAVILKIQPE